MSRFRISAERKVKVKRIVVKILKEPKAIIAVGALIMAIGLYASMQSAPYSPLILICGGFGLAIGIGEYRKMRLRQNKMKRKHIYVLIALGAMFSLYGFLRMWNDIPIHTSIVLIGAFILGVGTIQLRAKRSNARR